MANKSGKVSKDIFRQWFAEVYFPAAGRNSLLILDSYTVYNDRTEINKDKPRSAKYEISVIPPPKCQPLDASYFRTYKQTVRVISNYIHFHRQDIKLHLRNTVLKLQACVAFHFRSPRFITFMKYAWYKAGLLEDFDRSSRFINPLQYCLDKNLMTMECCADGVLC